MFAELTRNEELHGEYYDFYKEVHGIRPRWIYSEQGPVYTEQEMEQMLKRLAAEAKVVFAQEEAAQKAAVQVFEQRVAEVIASGAKDRETAIRWLFDAEEDQYVAGDPDYYCYLHGLPYGYFKKAA